MNALVAYFSASGTALRDSAPGSRTVSGRMLNGRVSENEVKFWVSGLKL